MDLLLTRRTDHSFKDFASNIDRRDYPTTIEIIEIIDTMLAFAIVTN